MFDSEVSRGGEIGAAGREKKGKGREEGGYYML